MTTHTTSPTKTLELGDTIVLRGHNLTVRLCGCGHQYSIDVPADLIDNAGLRSYQFSHEPLEGLTTAVQALFRAYPPEKPVFKVGQKWRTRNGDVRQVTTVDRPTDPYPIETEHNHWHRADGTSCINAAFDLVSLAAEDAPKEVPALAVGQKWRTRGGKIVTIKAVDRDFAVAGDVGIPWWYSNHARGKDCHAPGVLGADHPDTLVELVEDVAKPAAKVVHKPARGSIWRHKDGRNYMAVPTERWGMEKFSLVRLDGGSAGKSWAVGKGFDGDDAEFAYQGTGEELVKVRLPIVPEEKPKAQPRIEPVFKEGQVWRTKGGYLMRVHKIDPNGMGRARVIHTPQGPRREEYDRLWGIHPGGGYFNHESGTDDLTQVHYHDQMPKGNTDDRFAFVEPIAD